MTGINDIREGFLSFFETRGHAREPSAPLIPQNDPTLLFVNAGMVPFKGIFTGAESPPAPRVTSSQKCVRAGGKHNDLDNVGYTARHHTFFEMLGNFSFGDYFKEEAIALAWALVTGEFGLDPERLLVTVYHEDEEAAAIWKSVAGLKDERIIAIASSDNFWSMGETGPCGPCSEIFYDHGCAIEGGPPGSDEQDGDRFVEIWNLVFMQFDQVAPGKRVPLPKPCIDTGMGLERMATVLQGVHNNYDTDLFRALIEAEEVVYGSRAVGEDVASFRVIADHLRAASFLIADGVMPANEGRGYVLRRIMRRAMRHAHRLGAREPSMHQLVPVLRAEMGAAYPELGRAEATIEAVIEEEEARFQKTLGRGLSLLDEASEALAPGAALPGEVAFRLYDTYGFPLDLTADILRGRGFALDEAGFEAAMAEQRRAARAAWSGSGDTDPSALWTALAERLGPTDFLGYDALEAEARVIALVREGEELDEAATGEVELLLDRTPFYAESGGQAGDHGQIETADGARLIVRGVVKQAGRLHVHRAELASGIVRRGDGVRAAVEGERRRRIMANHSATHLLHAALRRVLGPHVTQKGSLVEEDRLRFDFSHGKPVTASEAERIEAEVNAAIRANAPTDVALSTPDEAIEAGALALFGERYGDEVRVLSIGPGVEAGRAYSVELCGGTHVERSGDIGVFTVMSETGVSAGVRRIEAATGEEALRILKSQAQVGLDLAERLRVPLKELAAKVEALLDERKTLDRQVSEARRRLALAGDSAGAGGEEATGPEMEAIGGVGFMARIVQGIGARDLRALVDEAKARVRRGVVVFVGVSDGKAAVSVGVTADLTNEISAVDLVRLASAAVGGQGGGGRPDMAQAGGPDAGKAEAALAAVREGVAAVFAGETTAS